MLSLMLMASLSMLALSPSSYKLATYFSHLFDNVFTVLFGMSKNRHNTSSLLALTLRITGNRMMMEKKRAMIEMIKIITIEVVSYSLRSIMSST